MKQLFYYFLLLSPVLAVAGSDNEGSPSKEKEGAENRPAARKISVNDLRIFAQLCGNSINKAAVDNPKIAALKGKLIEICEEKYQNHFNQNPDLTGAEAFAIVEKELNTVYEGKDLEEKDLIKAFEDLSPQKIFEGDLQKAMRQWEARIDNFIGQEEDIFFRKGRLKSARPQILQDCKKVFEAWHHNDTNQSKWAVAERIEERLHLLMTAHASNYDGRDLSDQLTDLNKSTREIRKDLVQKGQDNQTHNSFDLYSLEGDLKLDSALNQGLSQTKPEQKNYIKELITQVKKSGNLNNNLDEDLHREMYWGKYSDWATLSEEDLAYNLIDSYYENHYRKASPSVWKESTATQRAALMEANSRYTEGGVWKNTRLQKWAENLACSMNQQNPNPVQQFFTLAKIVKYSIDPTTAITETMTQLEKDLGEMLPPAQKDAILDGLDRENIHRVLLVGRLPYNLKGLGVVTQGDYCDISLSYEGKQVLSVGCSTTLGNSFKRDFWSAENGPMSSILSQIDLEAVGWKMTHPREQYKSVFVDEDRSAIQNLHKDLFYEKTLERLKEIGLLSSEKTEDLLNLEAEDLGQSRKILKKD